MQYKKFKGIIFEIQLKFKRFIRKIFKRKFYFVIGDSHASSFLHEAFISYHVGPATAFKLISDDSTSKSKQKIYKILKKIYKFKPLNIIFVFGEIDARIHINKVSNQKNIALDKVIDKTVRAYMDFLMSVKHNYPLINMYVFNVLPSGEEENIYKVPFYPNRKERMMITKKLNICLKTYCAKNKIKFIDVFDKLIDGQGNRLNKFIFDEAHYNRKIIPFVMSSLKKLNKQ